MTLRLVLVLALCLLPSCGRVGCEVPGLIAEPAEARPGDVVEVRPDGSLLPCEDRRSGTTFRPLPVNTYALDVMLARARKTKEGDLVVSGEGRTWGSVAYDEDEGTFMFSSPLPRGVTAGDYLVYLFQQPDSRAYLRVPPARGR